MAAGLSQNPQHPAPANKKERSETLRAMIDASGKLLGVCTLDFIDTSSDNPANSLRQLSELAKWTGIST